MILEVLASSVVIMAIFTSIYAIMLPTIAEYQKRENYTDIETVYRTHYVRKIFLKNYNNNSGINLNENNYLVLYDGTCNIKDELKESCEKYLNNLNIAKVILTKYDLSSVNYEQQDLKDYIEYLPNVKSTTETYRLIVKTNDNKYSTSSFLVENKNYLLTITNNTNNTYYLYNKTTDENIIINADEKKEVQVKYEDDFEIDTENQLLFNNNIITNEFSILNINNNLIIGSEADEN